MKIRLITVVIITKLTLKVCRLFGRGGTSLPGKIALVICPQFLESIASRFRVIMVTGTYGKTTTTETTAQILKENGIGYITNKSGANLVSGIASIFIDNMFFYLSLHFNPYKSNK